MSRTAGWVLLLAGAAGALAAADRPVASAARVDWPGARVVIDAVLAPDPVVANVSKARAQAEEEIRRQLPGILQAFLGKLLLDSTRTVGEALERGDAGDPDTLHRFPGRFLATSLSPDLREVRLRCEIPLYGADGLLTPFVTHSRPAPMRRVLSFVPSRAFTGLVIDARGLAPRPLRPALAIRLYDPQMRLLLELPMCDPEAVRRWGMAAGTDRYTDDVAGSEAPFRERIGAQPLRTLARGVYGQNGTDLILPDDAARLLLCREENRVLLRQGRILLITDPQP